MTPTITTKLRTLPVELREIILKQFLMGVLETNPSMRECEHSRNLLFIDDMPGKNGNVTLDEQSENDLDEYQEFILDYYVNLLITYLANIRTLEGKEAKKKGLPRSKEYYEYIKIPWNKYRVLL